MNTEYTGKGCQSSRFCDAGARKVAEDPAKEIPIILEIGWHVCGLVETQKPAIWPCVVSQETAC